MCITAPWHLCVPSKLLASCLPLSALAAGAVRHYKRCAQQKALAAGKSLSGAVAGGTQRGHGSGAATQATDLIVSVHLLTCLPALGHC
jgi:hypothetical protein